MKNLDDIQNAFNAISGKIVKTADVEQHKTVYIEQSDCLEAGLLINNKSYLKDIMLRTIDTDQGSKVVQDFLRICEQDAVDKVYIDYKVTDEIITHMDEESLKPYSYCDVDVIGTVIPLYRAAIDAGALREEVALAACDIIIQSIDACADKKDVIDNGQARPMREIVKKIAP